MGERVVVIGMGDCGLLSAIHLSPHAEVVGISTKPCMVSGQELGLRLAHPQAWRSVSLLDFTRYRKLDSVQQLHGEVEQVDTEARQVRVALATGQARSVPYDILLIASGVRNGFWRNGRVESRAEVEQSLRAQAERIAGAGSLAVVGGGPASVGAASNVKRRYPDKQVHLFFSREEVLPGYHPATRSDAMARLRADGVLLHPGHRAVVAEGFHGEELTTAPLQWETGQPPFEAELVLWAIGRVRPSSGFLPTDMLDAGGFVKVNRFLQVEGHAEVFAVGDVAASDAHRSSARNRGHITVARNIRAQLRGRADQMSAFQPPPSHRWGSVFGVQREGMRVYFPGGRAVTVRLWLTRWLLFRLIVGELIYKGIRRLRPRFLDN